MAYFDNPYPGASSFLDRHGKSRWRFRTAGKTISLPGQPGEPAFDAAYQAALRGQEPRRAAIHRLPGAATPESLGAAWRRVQQSAQWQQLNPATQRNNIALLEAWLDSRVAADDPTTWRQIPVSALKRRHINDILTAHAATPHKASHLLSAIRKLITAALDEEWIEVDPTYKIQWRPAYKGWRAWPIESMRAFESHWPIGSQPRLVYALGFWLGDRRSDIVTLRWDQRITREMMIAGQPRAVDGFQFSQRKTGKALFLPIAPALAAVLDATPRIAETIVITAYGKPKSAKALTNDMQRWTKAAGLPPALTLHGLRKSLGQWLAEGGASTRQLMDVLGHDNIEHAELYTRAAEQALLATEAMDRVVDLHQRRAARRQTG